MNFVGNLTEKGIVTNNYAWFKLDKLNREIDKEAIENLKGDYNDNVKDGEYPFQEPIVVFYEDGMDKAIIQKGHHRFTCCQEDNRSINYVITSTYRPPSRSQEEAHQDWTTWELVYSYAEEGIKEYILIKRLADKYGTDSLPLITLAIRGTTSAQTEQIRRRNYHVAGELEDLFKMACFRFDKFYEFLETAEITARSKEVFKQIIVALEQPNFKWDFFIDRCSMDNTKNEARSRNEFKSISTGARAKSLIEFYYNYNSRKSNFYFN